MIEEPEEELLRLRAENKALQGRVAELSSVLKLTPLQQREWRHAHYAAHLPEVEALRGLAGGRKTKLTAAVLVQAYRTWKDQGVPPFRIAKTLRVDHKVIYKFLDLKYSTYQAHLAYAELGLTPKQSLVRAPGVPDGPAEGGKPVNTHIKPTG